ncbi:MAG: CoA transferase, partial [Nitrospinota bacterium]|nr:CoA transferase [Nitrospinota bacterium]
MNPEPMGEGALAGLRVIESCQNLAGPYCGTVLADMGADVIKVEPPGGDHSRKIGRHFAGEESYAFMTLNRSKRGIVVDLKTEAGKGVFEELAAGADAIVENVRPGAMERMGLGYEDLKKIKPDIIMMSISAYGETGPYSRRGGIDHIIQAHSGLMSVSGEPDGPGTFNGVA